VLVEEDRPLLQLLRYVHRNPIKACIVSALDAYPWCSHSGYFTDEKRQQWLHRRPLLKMFSSAKQKAFSCLSSLSA